MYVCMYLFIYLVGGIKWTQWSATSLAASLWYKHTHACTHTLTPSNEWFQKRFIKDYKICGRLTTKLYVRFYHFFGLYCLFSCAIWTACPHEVQPARFFLHERTHVMWNCCSKTTVLHLDWLILKFSLWWFKKEIRCSNDIAPYCLYLKSAIFPIVMNWIW